MKVYISIDAEGITGVTQIKQIMPGTSEYAFTQSMMASDANAAVRGAFAAGATEVIICDAHHTGDNKHAGAGGEQDNEHERH